MYFVSNQQSFYNLWLSHTCIFTTALVSVVLIKAKNSVSQNDNDQLMPLCSLNSKISPEVNLLIKLITFMCSNNEIFF